jgi:hypothetical protein
VEEAGASGGVAIEVEAAIILGDAFRVPPASLTENFTLAVQAGKLQHRSYLPMLRENNVRTGFFERT